jgi:hypothetical protein
MFVAGIADLRVPDAVQRAAARIDRGNLRRGTARNPVCDGPRKSGLPDLRAFECRSRVNPGSVSAAHHFVLRCARDTGASARHESCFISSRAYLIACRARMGRIAAPRAARTYFALAA